MRHQMSRTTVCNTGLNKREENPSPQHARRRFLRASSIREFGALPSRDARGARGVEDSALTTRCGRTAASRPSGEERVRAPLRPARLRLPNCRVSGRRCRVPGGQRGRHAHRRGPAPQRAAESRGPESRCCQPRHGCPRRAGPRASSQNPHHRARYAVHRAPSAGAVQRAESSRRRREASKSWWARVASSKVTVPARRARR